MGQADEEKAKGNEYFGKQEFFKAAAHYSKAVKVDPANHVLYSNRSAAFMKMEPPKDVRALSDADKCVELKPDWAKGHYRRAQALISLDRFDDALKALQECVRLDQSMKKEAGVLTKQINAKKLKKCRETVELLQTKEQYKELKLVEDGLGICYSDERCASFLAQLKESVKLSAMGGQSTVKALDGLLVILPSKLSTKGDPENFHRLSLEQALLSEERQRQASKRMREEFANTPAHAIVFLTSKAALLAPRKWEQLKDTPPAKSDGIFLQFDSPTMRCVLFLPTLGKGKAKEDGEMEFVELEYKDYEILPSVFATK